MKEVGVRRIAVSIRTALFIVVTISIMPALAIIVITGFEHGAHLADTVKEDATRQVEAFANVQVRISESARQILSTVASLPGFGTGDPAAAVVILRAVHVKNPDYLNFTLTDAAGIVRASSMLEPGVDMGNRLHVRLALTAKRFSVGEYILGMVLATPSLPFALPILGAGGEVLGVLNATYKLTSYAELFENLKLPGRSFLGIVDRNGTRLFFYPPLPTNPIGQSIKPSVWRAIREGGDSGLFSETGSDGVGRYYAYRKLRLEEGEEPYLYVVYATPTAEAVASSRYVLGRNLVLMIVASILALSSANYMSRRLFGDRLERILATTDRLRDGDLRARTGMPSDRSDLGQIAAALDSMAETVEQRDAAMAEDARRLSASLAEKEILLKEIHHRVKNNLQLILSLFSLQEGEACDPGEFKDVMEHRIKSMAMVHEMLYESIDLGFIDLGEYAGRLLSLGSAASSAGVETTLELENLSCDLDTAIPFGLLLNELVTNAYKYAFAGRRDGKFRVSLRSEGDEAALEVEDDGPGLPEGFSIEACSSLGLKLVQALSEQLGGSFSWDSGPGTRFAVRFRTRRR